VQEMDSWIVSIFCLFGESPASSGAFFVIEFALLARELKIYYNNIEFRSFESLLPEFIAT
jgi:hypothetical protein